MAPTDPCPVLTSKPGQLQQTAFGPATDTPIPVQMALFSPVCPLVALFERFCIRVARPGLTGSDKGHYSQWTETGHPFHPRPVPQHSKEVAREALRKTPDHPLYEQIPSRLGY